MTTQYFKVRNGLSVGEDAVTIDATTGEIISTGDITVKDAIIIQGSTSGSSTFSAPATGSTLSYVLPGSGGAASTVLTNDGSGNLSWALPGGGGSTFGNVTVGVDTDQTISTTSGNLILQTAAGVNSGTITIAAGANGDITLAPNGTGDVVSGVTTMLDMSRVYGQAILTRNTTYTPPPSALTTVTGTNGIAVSSSTGGANGYGASVSIRSHTGDTTAAGNTSASIAFSGATGTSASPAGAGANLVLGTINYDGYTAGTSNNYATQIATTNQGGGTTALSPLQVQGYARQAFTNSTTVTTAVTGASGTGTVATLTFTTQNTAPYAVGQSVTIAGMTPSGYNGTYTITAATTSSISYANTTTGFTSGGTIAAANTVTAAGMGFRVRGFANSTIITAANRFNFMDLTATSATFKSNAYTFANEVITGSTLTATNYMTLGATTGSINQDTFTLKNTAGTTTYATANSTSVTLNGDTVLLRNTAGTTTYGNFTSTGTTITGAGLSTISRTTVGTPGVAESRPAMNIQLIRSDQAAPNNFDSTSFRTRVGGSNGLFYTLSDINSIYRTNGDVSFNINLANGDQTTGSFSGLSVFSSGISQTTIRAGTASATPGASTVSDVAYFTTANTTIKSDAVTLQTNAGVALIGNNISYNRVYGQWQYDTTVTPAASTTAYAFPIASGVTDFANIASVGSTSRIIPGAAGMYKLQFSVQIQNDDSASEHTAYLWWRKNGTDVPGSMGQVGVVKATGAVNGLTIAGWDNMIQSANSTDYWELMYAVDDANHVDFPAFAATAFGPSTAALFITLVPVGA